MQTIIDFFKGIIGFILNAIIILIILAFVLGKGKETISKILGGDVLAIIDPVAELINDIRGENIDNENQTKAQFVNTNAAQGNKNNSNEVKRSDLLFKVDFYYYLLSKDGSFKAYVGDSTTIQDYLNNKESDQALLESFHLMSYFLELELGVEGTYGKDPNSGLYIIGKGIWKEENIPALGKCYRIQMRTFQQDTTKEVIIVKKTMTAYDSEFDAKADIDGSPVTQVKSLPKNLKKQN